MVWNTSLVAIRLPLQRPYGACSVIPAALERLCLGEFASSRFCCVKRQGIVEPIKESISNDVDVHRLTENNAPPTRQLPAICWIKRLQKIVPRGCVRCIVRDLGDHPRSSFPFAKS